jgi:glutathione S-transferase
LPELYDHILSDRCYVVRLVLSLLHVPCTKRTVGYVPSQSPPSPQVLPLNPAGEIPVLVDVDIVVPDLETILMYLCRNYDPAGTWRAEHPDVKRWLSFAVGPLAAISQARAVSLFNAAGDRSALVAASRSALRVVEDHLTDRALAGEFYLAAREPSLADIAVFPPVALSHDCGVGHEDYPAINLWQRRMRRLPNFIGMPGIPDYF